MTVTLQTNSRAFSFDENIRIRRKNYDNGIPCSVSGPLWRESTGYRWIPITKGSNSGPGVFFIARLNKLFNKQLSYQWVETPWRSCDVTCNATQVPYVVTAVHIPCVYGCAGQNHDNQHAAEWHWLPHFRKSVSILFSVMLLRVR